ncbi:hypothetical protein MRY87_00465 [bacterium]|nr:hypothetical protein [bacterium]
MLLEKLLSLALLLTLTAISFHALPGVQRYLERLSQMTEQAEKIRALGVLFQQIATDLDSHRLPLLPKVHPPGKLLYGDDSPHPLSLRDGARSLHADSQVVTALRITPRSWTRVSASHEVCRRFPKEAHLLAFTGDLFFEANSFRGAYDENGCAPLVVSVPERSIFFIQPEKAAASRISLITPIRELYSLIVTESRELRYLQHRGTEIIENQPLITRAPLLTISPQANRRGLQLSLVPSFDSLDKKIEMSFPVHLERKELHALLLQQARIAREEER